MCKDTWGKPSPWILWRVGVRRLGWGPRPVLTVLESRGAVGLRDPAKRFLSYTSGLVSRPSSELEKK